MGAAFSAIVVVAFLASLAATLLINMRVARRIPAAVAVPLAGANGMRLPKPAAMLIWISVPILWSGVGVAVGTNFLSMQTAVVAPEVLLPALVQPVIWAAIGRVCLGVLTREGRVLRA